MWCSRWRCKCLTLHSHKGNGPRAPRCTAAIVYVHAVLVPLGLRTKKTGATMPKGDTCHFPTPPTHSPCSTRTLPALAHLWECRCCGTEPETTEKSLAHQGEGWTGLQQRWEGHCRCGGLLGCLHHLVAALGLAHHCMAVEGGRHGFREEGAAAGGLAAPFSGRPASHTGQAHRYSPRCGRRAATPRATCTREEQHGQCVSGSVENGQEPARQSEGSKQRKTLPARGRWAWTCWICLVASIMRVG